MVGVCILGIRSVTYHPLVNVTLTSDKFTRICIESDTYLIFFEVGITNLVCECIMGWRSVTYHFRVTVILTSDLVFRIIMFGAYLLY